MNKTDICNLALAALGQAAVSNLKEENERARQLDLFYDAARREVLRKHDWAFARAAAHLAALDLPKGENPSPGNMVYAYPAEALYIVRLFVPCRAENRLEFKEFFSPAFNKKCLSCRAEQVHAEYVRNVKDESQFTPDFCDMFALCLASKLAMTLTGDAQMAQLAHQKYMLALDEARLVNKTEEWDIPPQKSSFLEAR